MVENSPQSTDTQTKAEKDQKNRVTGLKALNIAIEFGFIIVLPLLAFGFLGKWLDNRYHQHFFVLLGILVALLTTGVWFYQTIKKLMKDMGIK